MAILIKPFSIAFLKDSTRISCGIVGISVNPVGVSSFSIKPVPIGARSPIVHISNISKISTPRNGIDEIVDSGLFRGRIDGD